MKTKSEFLAELTAGDVEIFLRSQMTFDEWMSAFEKAVVSNDETKKIYSLADVDNLFTSMESCIRAFMVAAKEGDADPYHVWFRVDIYGNVYTIGNVIDYMTDYMDDMADYIKAEYADELCEYYGYGEDEEE